MEMLGRLRSCLAIEGVERLRVVDVRDAEMAPQ